MILKPYYINRMFYDCQLKDYNCCENDVLRVSLMKYDSSPSSRYIFSKQMIESRKEDIKDALSQLSENFQKDKGYTFIDMKYVENGKWWGNTEIAEKLMAMGIAAGFIRYSFCLGFWDFLPDKRPYLIFNLDEPFTNNSEFYDAQNDYQ